MVFHFFHLERRKERKEGRSLHKQINKPDMVAYNRHTACKTIGQEVQDYGRIFVKCFLKAGSIKIKKYLKRKMVTRK